jgi:hypothetical protein
VPGWGGVCVCVCVWKKGNLCFEYFKAPCHTNWFCCIHALLSWYVFYYSKLNNSVTVFLWNFEYVYKRSQCKIKTEKVVIIVIYHFVFTRLFGTPKKVEIESLHSFILYCRLKHLTHHITELNLSCNALSQLPLEVGLCQNLQSLDLQKNLLVDLPQSFECLTRLRELVIAFNK